MKKDKLWIIIPLSLTGVAVLVGVIMSFVINPLLGLLVIGLLVWAVKKILPLIFSASSFSHGMSGYDYERYVAAHLKKCGFVKAEVTKKSGDFGADIILTDKDGSRMCVQCKQYSKPVGIRAVQEVVGARAYYHCTRAAVITTSTFTPAAKELAQKSGVELYENFYPKSKDDLDWIDRMEEIDSIIE